MKHQQLNIDQSAINILVTSTAISEEKITEKQREYSEEAMKLEKLEKYVQSAQDALSDPGKARVEREVATLKNNPQALQELGIPA